MFFCEFKLLLVRLLLILLILSISAAHVRTAYAHSMQTEIFPQITYEKGSIESISTKANGLQILHTGIESGVDKGKIIDITYDPQQISDLRIYSGEEIIINREYNSNGQVQYYVNDVYRLPQVTIIVVAFFILILIISGWKGIGSILGLIISLIIIFTFIIPQILGGHDPLLVAMIGSIFILLLTTYVAHGVSKQTSTALAATLVSLFLTYIIATNIVQFAHLNGYGNSDATDLHFGTTSIISLKGILLAGIIISTLGALNDVTVTQAATIFELSRQNSNLTFKNLFMRGFFVGREHAISIVNTIVLAFAGSGLAILIFFLFNPQQWPYWVIINSESVSEEIIKTIGGTAGLLLAVPLVTLLAAAVCDKEVKRIFKEILS